MERSQDSGSRGNSGRASESSGKSPEFMNVSSVCSIHRALTMHVFGYFCKEKMLYSSLIFLCEKIMFAKSEMLFY